MAIAQATASGHWVTIEGTHVHIGKGGVIDKGPKALEGKKPGDGGKDVIHHEKPDGHSKAKKIAPVNPVESKEKFEAIKSDMKKNGWQGPPVLAEEDPQTGALQAWTGSHRIHAARAVGVEVPYIKIDTEAAQSHIDEESHPSERNEYPTLHKFLGGSADDDDRLKTLKAIGDKRAAALMQAEIDHNEKYN